MAQIAVMALIIRIDVDRPYGRTPLLRHMFSRASSDLWFPAIEAFGYLTELKVILHALNSRGARTYIFFRRCTLPSESVLRLVEEGGHEIGLHLENSRSFETFLAEKGILERHIGRAVYTFSKHGSGGAKYGFHHHAPYEPDKYVEWAKRSAMRLFLGNLEDPSIRPTVDAVGFRAFDSAFWLEPAWRNTQVFTIDWLLSHAKSNDVVLLIHPENVLSVPALSSDFKRLLGSLETRILE